MSCKAPVLLLLFVIIILLLINYREHIDYAISDGDRDKIILSFVNGSEETIKRFIKSSKRGKIKAKDAKVAICGLCRDCEKSINTSMRTMTSVAKQFKDYEIVIVENDSKDSTRDILLDYAKTDPKIKILGCGINANSCVMNLQATNTGLSQFRMQKMANLRNIYLDYLQKQATKPDILIVYDFDIDGILFEDSVFQSVDLLSEKEGDIGIDAVTANGFLANGIYYDIYAHCAIGTSPIRNNYVYGVLGILDRIYRFGEDLVKVESAFGGMAIYRYDSVKNNRYDFSDDPKRQICEHYYFSKGINCYVNPSLLFYISKH